MIPAKVFMTSRSQSIRLPKKFRFEGKEFILREKSVTAEQLFKVLAQMPDDFYAEIRVDEPPQEREAI